MEGELKCPVNRHLLVLPLCRVLFKILVDIKKNKGLLSSPKHFMPYPILLSERELDFMLFGKSRYFANLTSIVLFSAFLSGWEIPEGILQRRKRDCVPVCLLADLYPPFISLFSASLLERVNTYGLLYPQLLTCPMLYIESSVTF